MNCKKNQKYNLHCECKNENAITFFTIFVILKYILWKLETISYISNFLMIGNNININNTDF